jgi:GNAT superfamily N-acetyltransferase
MDEDGLRAFDDALRQDVPGADGWVNDPHEFREYTFDDRHFDPATYLVAVDDVNQAYAGLARVWNNPGRPHLGLIGVMPGYRRRGLAKVLLAAVLAPLRGHGISELVIGDHVGPSGSSHHPRERRWLGRTRTVPPIYFHRSL